ncbi:MAG: hypothetical protein K9G26_01735 [Emcibacter sp.]|nr:hypothetical protein [Emcibacter sp.]
MENIILRIQGAESTLPVGEMSVERILAEARAIDLKEFLVLRNGEEIIDPDDLVVESGDIFVILPADYEDIEINVDIANDAQ